MKDYVLTLKAKMRGPDSFDEAKHQFEDCLVVPAYLEVNSETIEEVEAVLVDVQQLPRRAGGTIADQVHGFSDTTNPPVPVEAHEMKPEQHALIPPMHVIHPWDQGSWIFPEDHPLFAIEREAKFASDLHPEGEDVELKRALLQAGQGMGVIEGEVVDED